MTLRERFFAKVVVATPDKCWRWQAHTDKDGYGRLLVRGHKRNASRVAWFLAHGQWPPLELLVCHHCDNPACVNPAHLFLGTHAQNHEDRNRKGRQSRGERHGTAKLNDGQVAAIRAAAGVTQDELASQFGVSQAHISRIRSRRAREVV